MVGPRSPKPQTWVRFLPDPPVIIYNKFNNMAKQENEPYPEEIEALNEDLHEVIITFNDGTRMERFYDPENNDSLRLYVRDRNGKLTEFIDLKKPTDIYDYREIKNWIAERFKIIVTDGEAQEITDKIYKMNVKADMDNRKVLE